MRVKGDIDVERLAKYIRIDLEISDEHGEIKIPCQACGMVRSSHYTSGEGIGQCQAGRSEPGTPCLTMGGEKGSWAMAWWFLNLAEMASKPVGEVAHIKAERYEDYPEDEPEEEEPDASV